MVRHRRPQGPHQALVSAPSLSQTARDYIVDSQFSVDALRKEKAEGVEELLACEPLESYTNFNGIIGRCLYLMKRYSGVS